MSEALVREKTASVFGGMFRQISALAIGIPLLRKKSESTLGLYFPNPRSPRGAAPQSCRSCESC